MPNFYKCSVDCYASCLTCKWKYPHEHLCGSTNLECCGLCSQVEKDALPDNRQTVFSLLMANPRRTIAVAICYQCGIAHAICHEDWVGITCCMCGNLIKNIRGKSDG